MDKWIPTLPGGRILPSPSMEEMESECVAEWRSETGGWNIETTNMYLTLEDVEAIMNVPHTVSEQVDVLYWNHTKNG